MRIDRLDLRAFGPFTNQVIDLTQGHEGFHIVYGRNEAGKSSALRAITQLFYGIPSRTADDFIHPMGKMRIGAAIRHDGRCLEFVRRKGTKATLLDATGETVIDEAELQAQLGGVDEETFTTVFGLHHEQLVAGGRAILEDKGNIGHALFAASAGLGNLRAVLSSLQEEAAALFKPTGSIPSINAKIAGLKEKRRQLKNLQLRPEEWARVGKALGDAQEKREEIQRAAKSISAERNRLDRILRALPLMAKREAALAGLAPVTAAVLLPQDFGERWRRLLQEGAQAQSDGKIAEERLDAANSSISGLSINDEALTNESLVEELYLRSAVNGKALDDSRQNLEPEFHLFEAQARKSLGTLRPGWDLQDAEKLRLNSARRQDILDLGQESGVVESKFNGARANIELLDTKRRSVAAEMEKAVDLRDPADLEQCVGRIRKLGDLESLLRDLKQEHEAATLGARAGLSRLGLWDGPLEAIEGVSVPSQATIERFRTDIDDQLKGRNEIEKRLADLVEKKHATKLKIESLRRGQNVPTEEILFATRDAREQSWRLVRRSWETAVPPNDVSRDQIQEVLARQDVPDEIAGNLADAHEFIAGKVDNLSDRLRREADRVAELAQLEVDAIDGERRLSELRSAHVTAERQHAETTHSWIELWRALGIAPTPPREMAPWAQAASGLVAMAATLRERSIKMVGIGQAIEESRDELNKVLGTLGGPGSAGTGTLAALLDRADNVAASMRKATHAHDHVIQQLSVLDSGELPAAQRAVSESSDALAKWQRAWGKAMTELGEAPDATPKHANAIIQQIDDLLSALDKATERKMRIDQIAHDDEDFREKVKRLALTVAPELDLLPADVAVLALNQLLGQSKHDSTRLTDIGKQKKLEEERIRKAKAILVRGDEGLKALCKEAQVISADALPDAEERSTQRRGFEQSLMGINERLVELSSGDGLGNFLEMARRENPDMLESAISGLNRDVEEKEADLKTVSEEIGEHRKVLGQMDGSAGAAQANDEAQAILASMATDVERFVRLRIAEFVLVRAIEQYRANNQGPLLRRAGEIFAKLTLDSFETLTPDFGDNGENILVGRRPGSGESIRVSGMSDGTADQLYLSLRLASLELYLEKHPAVPLILDDILINFDDERAVATMRILADLSRRTQVIFFTHHRHLAELAEASLERETLFTHTLA